MLIRRRIQRGLALLEEGGRALRGPRRRRGCGRSARGVGEHRFVGGGSAAGHAPHQALGLAPARPARRPAAPRPMSPTAARARRRRRPRARARCAAPRRVRSARRSGIAARLARRRWRDHVGRDHRRDQAEPHLGQREAAPARPRSRCRSRRPGRRRRRRRRRGPRAMVGCGCASSVRSMRGEARARRRGSASCGSRAMRRIQLRSAPAQKASPAPGEHHDAHRAIAGERAERLGERGDQLVVEARCACAAGRVSASRRRARPCSMSEPCVTSGTRRSDSARSAR